eukprot:TRINITY_DN7506_c0_g1_i1.p1 TRINITY_DN7506_c0_g1~~TRINITY_DN7506_c0_g1_i1.p1  ORF type:complete len:430 (-),score=64.30 TRINITY_DN7506_c0_g1_i1:32-1321(-)
MGRISSSSKSKSRSRSRSRKYRTTATVRSDDSSMTPLEHEELRQLEIQLDYDDISRQRKPQPIVKPKLKLRDAVYEFLEDPTTSFWALLYSIINFTAILISTITFLITSLPHYWVTPPSALWTIEIVVIIIFTFDYLAKIILYRGNRLIWAINFLNMVDFLAIIPFYIEVIVTEATKGDDVGGLDALVVLRVLRLFRVFRIFKVLKYFDDVPTIQKAITRSTGAFGLLIFTLGISMVLFASLMFYAEQTDQSFYDEKKVWLYSDGSESTYQSIPHALWWVIVTITTVGYGDSYPVTDLGKVVAILTMLSGLLVLAFPLTILGSNFAEVYEERQKEKQIKNVLDLRTRILTMKGRTKLIYMIKDAAETTRFELKYLKNNLEAARYSNTKIVVMADRIIEINERKRAAREGIHLQQQLSSVTSHRYLQNTN